jgi:hypothetical protein
MRNSVNDPKVWNSSNSRQTPLAMDSLASECLGSWAWWNKFWETTSQVIIKCSRGTHFSWKNLSDEFPLPLPWACGEWGVTNSWNALKASFLFAWFNVLLFKGVHIFGNHTFLYIVFSDQIESFSNLSACFLLLFLIINLIKIRQ